MKAFIGHIGIVDNSNKIHAVSFGPGVNVVTGRSSTGKSALIEIFDFCFGSSDFTVPDGVITQNAIIYFTVLHVQKVLLVLARKRGERTAFLKEEPADNSAWNINSLGGEYFENGYFLPLSDFKKELGRYFGLILTDVEESAEARKYRGNRKSSPSIRSFASFMLQHQNLVANKHAIFYRFDEREKREQAIEHFKIFAGFVDQAYFLKAQDLDSLESEARRLESQIPRLADAKTRAEAELTAALAEYRAISGNQLLDEGSVVAVRNPKRMLDRLEKTEVAVVPLSEEHAVERERLEKMKASATSELRKYQVKASSIRASVTFAQQYAKNAEEIPLPSEAELRASECPFCHSRRDIVEKEALRLEEAIDWLNRELERSPYMLESFEEEERATAQLIQAQREEIASINDKIATLDRQIADLSKHRSQYELALKSKLRIEAILESLLRRIEGKEEERLTEVRKQIAEIRKVLKESYDVESKLKEAESAIAEIMGVIGNRFEFEESYRPIKLHFSLETFDLWHQSEDRHVFLRSMGSGANWLYCHITLFLALHRYFCRLGDKCLIPSILFLDQPSQVYFPSALDTGDEFSPSDLAQIEGQSRKRPVDDDVKAVTNLYSQLARFCKETLRETGIEPQIIVTDHADKLELEGDTTFEELVQGRRWRTRGFIDVEARAGEVVEKRSDEDEQRKLTAEDQETDVGENEQ